MTSPIIQPHPVPVSDIPDPVGMLRAAGVFMSEAEERAAAIIASTYVLVRIDGVGERWRCMRCNCRHEFFTVMCVPRPFRGLRHGLRAYWQNTAIPDSDLSPEQRQRRQEVAGALGFAAPLSARHPQTAAALHTPDTDTDLGAWVLGTIEPISEVEARRYAATINARARQPVIRL